MKHSTVIHIYRSYPDPENPNERKDIVVKLRWSSIHTLNINANEQRLVSQDPGNYEDAPTEGIRRILESLTGEKIPRGHVLKTDKIGSHERCQTPISP